MAKKGEGGAHAPVALYRKYRPSTFAEVRGQQEVVKVLEAAIKSGSVAHAYLFAGSRGTGKTSMARIFARALEVHENDIYEMDAASNRGIEEVRQLREGVATMPFQSKYKFYIIDEAHALTKDAWGAFLKTLEEPPEHVIFVLATTELERIPETIISRCQVFNFKKPSTDVLRTLVLDVAKQEGASLSPGGAELVALMGEGSFRDTLGTLQKVLTLSGGKKLSDDEVAAAVGAPAAAAVNAFLEALAGRDIAAALGAFHSAAVAGAQPQVFVQLSVAKARAVLLLRFAPKLEPELAGQFSEEDVAVLKKLSGKEGATLNAELLAALITALIEMPRAPVPAIPLELALYRLLGEQK